MPKRNTLTKILAIVGTIAVSLPILVPLIFAILHFFVTGRFLFDYLMPAEFSLLALGGGAALLWVAITAKLRIQWIAWSLGLAVLLLFGSQGIAVITGLANGDTPMGGWEWAVVLSMLIGYILAIVSLAAGGAFLIRDLKQQ